MRIFTDPRAGERMNLSMSPSLLRIRKALPDYLKVPTGLFHMRGSCTAMDYLIS
jgi:hypothetical protein